MKGNAIRKFIIYITFPNWGEAVNGIKKKKKKKVAWEKKKNWDLLKSSHLILKVIILQAIARHSPLKETLCQTWWNYSIVFVYNFELIYTMFRLSFILK